MRPHWIVALFAVCGTKKRRCCITLRKKDVLMKFKVPVRLLAVAAASVLLSASVAFPAVSGISWRTSSGDYGYDKKDDDDYGILGDFGIPTPSEEQEQVDTGISTVKSLTAHTGRSTVNWFYDGEGIYYLFMPACADLSAVKLSFTASDELVFNGAAITDGAIVALEDNGEYSVSCGGEDCVLKVMKSQNIPAMFINTDSGSMESVDATKYTKESGTMLFLMGDGSAQYNGKLEYIKGRGNSSWTYSKKKPYNIKTTNKVNLCGMGKSRKWSLVSNYLDHTMLRNVITYEMGRDMGLDYTIDSQQIDLYTNGNYRGTYLLCEKVEIDKDRVDITDLEKATEEANNVEDLSEFSRGGTLINPTAGTCKYYNIPNNPDDITGGYILEFQQANRYWANDSGFISQKNQPVIVKSPECVSKEQMEYISELFQQMEDAVYSEDGYNSLGRHYSEYLDLSELATVYLIQELSSNPDANTTSFFCYKESDLVGDGKFHFAPLWDYDLAYRNYVTIQHPADAFFANCRYIVDTETLTLTSKLYQDPYFQNIIIQKFFREMLPIIQRVCSTAPENIGIKSMRQRSEEFSRSYEMNYVLWDMTDKPIGRATGTNLYENINYIERFLTARSMFLVKSWLPTYFNINSEYVDRLFYEYPQITG